MEACAKCRLIRRVTAVADNVTVGLYIFLGAFFGAQVWLIHTARKVLPASEQCATHRRG